MSKTTPDPTQQSNPPEQAGMEELARFLLSPATADATMMLDSLDGYLTAIVIGPTSIKTSEWLPHVWGPGAKDEPAFETYAQAERILELILQQRNNIINNLQQHPDQLAPVFDTVVYEGDAREYLDGEMWAQGFMKGLKLREADWQPLLTDPAGIELLRPIYLLGAEQVSDAEETQVATAEQREALTKLIPASIAAIYRYWLPLGQNNLAQSMAGTFQREHAKTGRNDPCPCGSGKKFKKCCGAATTLQ